MKIMKKNEKDEIKQYCYWLSEYFEKLSYSLKITDNTKAFDSLNELIQFSLIDIVTNIFYMIRPENKPVQTNFINNIQFLHDRLEENNLKNGE